MTRYQEKLFNRGESKGINDKPNILPYSTVSANYQETRLSSGLIAVKCALSHIEGGWLTKNKSTFKLRIVLRIRIDGRWT